MIAIMLFVFKLLMESGNNQGSLFGEPANSKENNVDEIHYNPTCEALTSKGVRCTKKGYNPMVWEGHRYTTCGDKAHKVGKFGMIELPADELAKRAVGRITAAWLGEGEEHYSDDSISEIAAGEDLSGDRGGEPEGDTIMRALFCHLESGLIHPLKIELQGEYGVTLDISKTAGGAYIGGRWTAVSGPWSTTHIFCRLYDGSHMMYKVDAAKERLIDVTDQYNEAKANGQALWVK